MNKNMRPIPTDRATDQGKSGAARLVWRFFSAPTVQLFGVLLLLSGFRLYSLEVASRQLMDCSACLSAPGAVFELRYLLIAMFVHVLGRLTPIRTLRATMRVAVCGLVLLYVADLMLLKQLHVRLTLTEIRAFASQFDVVGSFVYALLLNAPIVAITMGTIVIVLIRYVRCSSLAKASPKLALLTGVSIALVGCLEPENFHRYYLENPLEALLTVPTRNTPYSSEFQNSFHDASTAPAQCLPSLRQRPNLIVVLVESLSLPHSKLFSGMNDWTPELDALAQRGLRLNNFYANGFTTEQGLISILTGEPPIEKGLDDVTTIFEQFNTTRQTLPRALNELGYQTAFFTTGNLGFLNKGKWLEHIGFSTLEGHESEFYRPFKRYAFDAAPDDALYAYSLKRLAAMMQTSSSPVFAVLETVTTHAPYIDPNSGMISHEKVVRYADHALGDFVRKLTDDGYFDNGYLMVLGDHRAMVPATASELAAYGDRAYALTPFVMVGHGMAPTVETRSFSQTDLLVSLQHWLGEGKQCLGPNQGVFLPQVAKTPNCIYTRRSYAENNVNVQCGASDYSVVLDGDDTHFASEASGPDQLLQEIHGLRLNYGMSHDQDRPSRRDSVQAGDKRVVSLAAGSGM